MKKLFSIITLLTLMVSMSVDARHFFDNLLEIGKEDSQNIELIFKKAASGNPMIRWNQTDEAFEKSPNGVDFSPIGSGSGSGGGINTLVNEGFESALTTGWTSSGGTHTQESYTNALASNKKFSRFVASTASQYFETVLTAVPDSLGIGCMADLQYDQGDNAFTYSVIDSGSNVLASGSVGDLSGWEKAPTLTFQCPVPGATYKLRVESTAAGTIDVDNAYLGSNKGLIPTVLKAETVEKILTSNITSNQIISDLTFSGLEVGARYELSGQMFLDENGSNSGVVYATFTTGSDVHGQVYQRTSAPTTGAQNHTQYGVSLKFTATDTSLITTSVNGTISYILGDGTKNRSFLQLTKISSKSVQAFTPPQSDFTKEEGFLYKSAISPNSTNSTFAPVIVSGGTGFTFDGNGFSELCSGTEQPVGGECPTTTILGFRYNVPRSGKVEVCGRFTTTTSGNSTTKIVKVSNSDSSVVLQDNNSPRQNNATSGTTTNNCSIFNIDSSGDHSFAIYHATTGTTTFYIDNGAGGGGTSERKAKFTIEMKEYNVARPVIQNMVDTKDDQGLRIQTCRVNNNGVASSQSPNCDSWIDSYQVTSAGNVTITFLNGTFSNAPDCTMTIQNSIASSYPGVAINLPSTSSEVRTTTLLNASPSNQNFYIQCVGLR